MNKINEIMKLNQMELDRDLPFEQSWHQTYKNCPWIYFGGISTDLSEGDIICLFSQWGEVEDINLVRDQDTGKSKGFGFLRYEDWLSTVLAVDNFNGMELLGRIICVDHKKDYQPPKKEEEEEEKSKDRHRRSRSRSRSRHHSHRHHRHHHHHRDRSRSGRRHSSRSPEGDSRRHHHESPSRRDHSKSKSPSPKRVERQPRARTRSFSD